VEGGREGVGVIEVGRGRRGQSCDCSLSPAQVAVLLLHLLLYGVGKIAQLTSVHL